MRKMRFFELFLQNSILVGVILNKGRSPRGFLLYFSQNLRVFMISPQAQRADHHYILF